MYLWYPHDITGTKGLGMATAAVPPSPGTPAAEPLTTVVEEFDLDLQHVEREQLYAIYLQGFDAIVTLIAAVVAIVQHLLHDNHALREQVADLEQRLHYDSHNSSKPPSSDGYGKRPKPPGERSGRSSGGQRGHVGATLAPVAEPDAIVSHRVTECNACGCDLSAEPAAKVHRRQVRDLVPQPFLTTEHQAEVKICPQCRHQNTAAFPEGVTAPVQYGPEILALITYLHCYQLIPIERIREWFADVWHIQLSTGPVMRSLNQIADRLTPVMETVRLALQKAPHTVCADETGMRVQAALQWFHVVSTSRLTFLFPHKHRGHAAMDALDVLPHRPADSNTMHDGLAAYQKYPGKACLCNAHHERELKDAAERTQQEWAPQLGALLYEMKDAADAARAAGASAVAPDLRATLRARYDALLRTGLEQNPEKLPAPGRRRRPAQTKVRNLLERLDRDRDAALRFLDDVEVPFTNNLAERDLRMLKVRQHISGSFRTAKGAERFATIRGYLQTARKQDQSLLEVLRWVVRGRPWEPDTG